MEATTHSLADFEAQAASFVRGFTPGAQATLVTLSGELGAGKTAFVKAAAKALGVAEDITSPTFVLLKKYDLPPNQGVTLIPGFKRLVHIDAYRLESGKDLAPLRFDELLQEADNLIMLEWPEKVADALPSPAAHVSIETLDENSRKITYA
jgi:tRNA threonylcarbamoyladenosine biosynthesis protein TsaE